MEQIWLSFCCDGYGFIVFDCDSSGYGYGICTNPKCPHGDDTQAFQLDWYDEEVEEEAFL